MKMKSLLIKSLFLSILGIGSYPGIQVANATEVPTPIYKYAVLSAGGPPHYSLLPATDLNDAIMQTEAYYLARVQGLPCNPYVETSKTGYTLESLTPISSPPGEGDGSEEIFSQIVSYTGIGGPLGICFPPYNLSQQTTRYSVINCPTGMYDDVLQQCVSSNDIDEEENLGDEEDCSIGNPINPHTGNKYQIEEDFVGTGNFALVYRRYYNSNASVISANLGRHWRGMYDKSIAETNDIAKVIRSDGKVLEYAGTNGVWDADPNIIETLDEITDAQNQRTGWQFTTSDDTVEDYDADGKLLTLTIRNSLTQSLTYNVSSANGGDDNSNTLDTVTDSFSRSLSFTYDANSRVSSMTEPNGNTYNYAYDANNNLSTVTYPDETPGNSNDNPTRIYHYEDTNFIHALTGITDETGNRFATWGYNTEGKAIFSEHAGGAERVDFIYNNDGTTLVTDSLGNSQPTIRQ